MTDKENESKIFVERQIEIVSEVIKDCENDRNSLIERAKKLTKENVSEAKRCYIDATAYTRLELALRVIGSIMTQINSISQALEKLPNRNEFDGVKNEVKQAKQTINDAVIPVKKLYHDAKEREIRGEDLYG